MEEVAQQAARDVQKREENARLKARMSRISVNDLKINATLHGAAYQPGLWNFRASITNASPYAVDAIVFEVSMQVVPHLCRRRPGEGWLHPP